MVNIKRNSKGEIDAFKTLKLLDSVEKSHENKKIILYP